MRFKGYYLLDPKLKPTGSNRVDFRLVIDSDQLLSLNDAPFRHVTNAEIEDLRTKYNATGEVKSVF